MNRQAVQIDLPFAYREVKPHCLLSRKICRRYHVLFGFSIYESGFHLIVNGIHQVLGIGELIPIKTESIVEIRRGIGLTYNLSFPDKLSLPEGIFFSYFFLRESLAEKVDVNIITREIAFYLLFFLSFIVSTILQVFKRNVRNLDGTMHFTQRIDASISFKRLVKLLLAVDYNSDSGVFYRLNFRIHMQENQISA